MRLVHSKSLSGSARGERPVALVTGASGKLGPHIVATLAGMGYAIAIHYAKNRGAAESIKRRLDRDKIPCATFRHDFSKPSPDARELPGRVYAEMGRLDCVVIAASTFPTASLASFSSDAFDHVTAVNVKAPLAIIRGFSEFESGGVVVTILDSRIADNRTKHGLYLLTKKALADVTRMSAVEYGPAIRINGIAPGIVVASVRETPELLDRVAASAVASSADPLADFRAALQFIITTNSLTGEIIFVDAGRSL